MAVEALPSKFTMRWNTMCALMMFGMAVWFFYDGHYNQEYIKKHTNEDGTPMLDLKINRSWGPAGCALTGLYFIYITWGMSRKKISVDEKGITFSDGKNIPLDSLTRIDKSKFKTKGKLLIEYEAGGKTEQIILKDTVYDGINSLLQEILRLTGKDKEMNQAD